jgi:MtN3 and saliva related transmembrane protein
MSLGYYPQAWKVFKTKSAKDISISSFVIFSIGTASWLCYGLYLHDFTIILSFALGVVGSWTILILSLWYRRKR